MKKKYNNSILNNIAYLEKTNRAGAKCIYDANCIPGLNYHHESQSRYHLDDHGVLQGPYKEWNPNGSLFTVGTYVDGIKDGHWKDWYGNGQLWEEIDYEMGVKHGHYKYYSMDGELLIHRLYRWGEEWEHYVEKEVFPPSVG